MNEQEFVSTFLNTEIIYAAQGDDVEQSQKTGWFDIENGYYVRVFKVADPEKSECRYVTGVYGKAQNGTLQLDSSSGRQIGCFEKGRIDLINQETLDFEGLKKFLSDVATAPSTAFAEVAPVTKDLNFAKKVIPLSKVMPKRIAGKKPVCCPECNHKFEI